MSIISLLTDFGCSDSYVGIMKGVILGIAPKASIVDVSHDIDPQDIVSAAYMIDSVYSYFPEKTVHAAVVDPGVGSGRKIIAAEAGGHYFVAPDNGILTKVFDKINIGTLVRVENPEYFIHPVSRTFHGRDIFAPVIAYMAAGKALDAFGPPVSSADIVRLDLPVPYFPESGQLRGEVITVDRFGNLITNIDPALIRRLSQSGDESDLRVHVGSHEINGLSGAYGDVLPGQLLALIGSRGYLEISVNQGHAQTYCGVERGAPVTVTARERG